MLIDNSKADLTQDLLEQVSKQFPGIPSIDQTLNITYQLSEQMRNKASILHGWVNTLPTEQLSLPLYWTNANATSSQYFAARLYEESENCRAVFNKMLESEPRLKSRLTIEEFMWTLAMANSRSLAVEGVSCMIPLINAINHSNKPNCRLEYRDNHYELHSLRYIEAGQEFLLDYGPYDDYEYLLRWGFVPDDNPRRVAITSTGDLLEGRITGLNDKLPIDDLHNPARLSMKDVKQKLLSKLGSPLLTEARFAACPPSCDEAVYRALLFTIQDALAAGIQSVDILLNHDFNKPLTKSLERKVAELMAKICEAALDGYSLELDGEEAESRLLEGVEQDVLRTNRDFYLRRLVVP